MFTNPFFCIFCGTALERPADSGEKEFKCTCCARLTPVPGRVAASARTVERDFELPAEVIELSMKFLCTGCGSPLRADVEWAGQPNECPFCREKITIPHWPEGLRLRRTSPVPSRVAAVQLSADEIQFLSGMTAVAETSQA